MTGKCGCMRFLQVYSVERAICGGFFLLVLVAGVALCAFVAHDFTRARESLSWPTAEGVHFETARGVRYAYSWRGKNYVSSRARFFTGHAIGHGVFGEPQCPACITEVRLSPENPNVSVLIPGAFRSTFAFFVAFSGVLIFVGGGGVARTFAAAVEAPEAAGEPLTPAQDPLYND